MTTIAAHEATKQLETPRTVNPGGGGLLVAGIVAAVAIGGFMLLSKKKETPKPLPGGQIGPVDPGDIQPCPLDYTKINTWASSKGLFAIYGATLQTPPDLSAVLQAFALPNTTPEGTIVVITANGGFYKYSGGKPVAAPDLRDSYCKYQTVPVLPPAPTPRNAQSSLSGQALYSPTFL